METDTQSKDKGRQRLPRLPKFSMIRIGVLYHLSLAPHSLLPAGLRGCGYVYPPGHQVGVMEAKWPQHVTHRLHYRVTFCQNKLRQAPRYSLILQQDQASSWPKIHHHYLILENHHPPEGNSIPIRSYSLSWPSPLTLPPAPGRYWQPLIQFLSLGICPYWALHMKGILQYVAFPLWFLLLNMFLRFIPL